MTVRATLALVVLSGLLAACASDPPDAPDGYALYEGDEHVTFAVPDHFDRTPAGEELGDGVEVEFLADPDGEGPVPTQITLGYGVPDSQTFDLAAWPAFAFGPMTGENEQLDEEEVEVTGADDHGLRVTYRFDGEGLDEPVRTAAVGVLLDGPDGRLIADLRYSAVESEYDEQVADEVLSSLAVR